MTTKLIAFLDEARKATRNPATGRVDDRGLRHYVVAAAAVIDGDTMTNPVPTDGPIPAGITAGIDETVIDHGGGVTYVLAGVVFIDAQPARRAFQQLTANRSRPFHWREEGPTLRQAAVSLTEKHVVVAHLIIESQGTDLDGRDRNTILDLSRAANPEPGFTYEWRTKTEPLLWYPDALAGVAHQYLTDGQSHHYQRLQKASVVTDIRYVADRHPRNA